MTLLVGTVANIAGQDYTDFVLIAQPVSSFYSATGGRFLIHIFSPYSGIEGKC